MTTHDPRPGACGTDTSTPPRLYVASLSDYNAGRLHGVWIDATDDPADIAEQIAAMLAASPEARAFPIGGPAEEYAIHDYDGFGPLASALGEHESIERLHAIAELIAEHGPAFIAWYSHDPHRCGLYDPDDLGDLFAEAYRGEWDSERAYAMELAYDLNASASDDLPWPLSGCIDWDAVARVVFDHGTCYSVRDDGTLYVFEDCGQ
jgi:antirestriction protein